jgi:hypothetical protein
MKTLKKLAVAAILAGTLGGCSYGGVAASGEWAVVTVNNGLLFGMFNKAYVCKITPQGLSQCTTAESP